MEEKKNIPEIRFKGFEGEWEENIFGSTFTYLTSNTLSRAELNYKTGTYKNVHYGDVLIKFGELLDIRNDQIPFITHDKVAEKINSSILQNGDVVIADTAEDESVGKCTELINIKHEKAVAGLHTIPVRPIGSFASKYLGYYMNSPSFHNQLIQLMQGIKVLSVSKSSIKNTTIKYPAEKKEQSQIGSFFQNLDKQITLEQQKHDKLVTLKKAMLEKMFPKEGEDVPEIRFKGFEEKWEERKLGDISEIIAGGDIDKQKISQTGEYPVIANALTNDGVMGYYNDFYRIKAPAVTVTGRGDIGHARARKVDFTPVERLLALTSVHNVDFLENGINKIKVIIESTGVPQLTAPQLRNYEIDIPDSKEQTKIGSFFQNLDKLISLQQKKIDKLKNIKKACLEKMFV